MSVPYALKALDAETIGGKPASSFMLAPAAATADSSKAANLPPGTITGHGVAGFIPVFTGPTTIADSKIFQTVGLNVGVGTAAPAAKLDVAGTEDIRDTLKLFPKAAHPTLTINGTAFAISNAGVVTFVASQTFPGTVTKVIAGAGLAGGGGGTPTLSVATAGVTNAMLQNSTLSVNTSGPLSGGGSIALGGSRSIGLNSCGSNQILEFTGGAWTCVAIPAGTITGVTAGTDLTGGGNSGNVTLNLDTTKVPQLAAANSFTNNNAITANDSSASLTVANTSNGDAIDISENGSGAGLFVNGGAIGVDVENAFIPIFANSPSSGIEAVFAEANNDGNQIAAIVGVQTGATTGTIGVEGISSSPFFSSGVGVYGVEVSGNTLIGESLGAGVVGDSAAGFGIEGLSDQEQALTAVNADSNNTGAPAAFINNINSSPTDPVLYVEGGTVGGTCIIDTSGDISCTGAKNAVVPVDGGARKVALNAVEAPDNWFEDAGSANLSNGEAVVNLEPVFGQTVNTETEYHVFLTPNGDCKGLYVAQKSATSFVVRELGAGTSSIAFDYRIMAKRKGYESIRLVDKTRQFQKPASMVSVTAVGRPWKYHAPQRPPARRNSSIRPVSQAAKR